MPQLPIYESPAATQGLHPSNAGAEAFALMGRHIRAEFGEIGQEAASVGRVIDDHEFNLDTTDLSNNIVSTVEQQQQKWEQAKASGVRAEDFIKNSYAPAMESLGDNLRTQRGQSAANNVAKSQILEFSKLAFGQQAEIDKDNAVNTINGGWDRAANQARLAPDSVGMLAKQNAQTSYFQGVSAGMPKPEIDKVVKRGLAQVYGNAADGIVSTYEGNPNSTPDQAQLARDLLSRDDYVSNVDPKEYAALMNRLDTAKRTKIGVSLKEAEVNAPDFAKQMTLNGGNDVDNQFGNLIAGIRGIGTPEALGRAAELQREFNGAEAWGKAAAIAKDEPHDAAWQDFQALKDKSLTATGDDVHIYAQARDAMYKFLTDRDKAFADGKSAKWELDNNTTVGSLYQKWQQNPDDAKAFNAYATASTAEQERLYPGRVPSVLTTDIVQQAQNVVTSISRDPKAGPMGAAQSLQQMSQTYGSYWPSIAGDLRKKGVFNGDQFVAASLYSNPQSVGMAEDILRASAMTKDQRFDAHGVNENAARGDAITALQPLQASFGNMQNGGQLFSDYVSALSKVIQLQSVSNDNRADADQLAGKMLLDSFQFVGPGKTLRIPAGADGTAIENGIERVTDGLDKREIVVPAGRLGPTAQRANYTHELQMTGRWYTSADGKSAELYDQYGNPVSEVVKGKRQPITVPLPALAQAAEQQRGPAPENIPGASF